MVDIITGPGSYRTVDGRRVEIESSAHAGGDKWIWYAANLNCMMDGKRVHSGVQKYHPDGAVFTLRKGEENDRIVGPWVEPVITGPGDYVTRSGVKATIRPEDFTELDTTTAYRINGIFAGYVFKSSGRRGAEGVKNDRLGDIVGPWVEPEKTASIVREFTERRIVPGVYGIVGISKAFEGYNVWIPTTNATSDQLRAAARTLTELADFTDS